MNPFSKTVNPRGKVEILKKFLDDETLSSCITFKLSLNLNNIIGQEVTICSSRSDISSITIPSSYNTPRLDDDHK